MLVVVEHPHFRPWLASLPGAVAAKVVDGIEYLREHGRAAVLPDVRHRIQTSRHFPDMSEVRADQIAGGRRFVVRVLVCFVDEDQIRRCSSASAATKTATRTGGPGLVRRLRAGG